MYGDLMVAQPTTLYQIKSSQAKFFEVLVDCPGIQGLYAYSCPQDLTVKVGDIVSVQFGAQQIGGIVIRELQSPPQDLAISRIKEIDDIIVSGFFTAKYWQIIEKVASYYYAELITVIKVALPPGLLRKETRRIKLNQVKLTEIVPEFCSEPAQEILRLLKGQKDGDYSEKYLKQNVRNAHRGIRDLLKREWVISYLETPQKIKPKLQKAVVLINDIASEVLGEKQTEALETLKNLGGEVWLKDFKKNYLFSDSVIKALVEKGCVILENREKLRLAQEISVNRDNHKQLTLDQQTALDKINNLSGYHQVLLHGITGSGKTEVYIQAIAPILAQGKSALILVPEISLTPQLTDRFTARFGDKVFIYHSGLNDGERYDTWRNMLNTEQLILIGTRSAVFAPLKNLGLIILDEEHDSSYKQQQPVPNYHAKTVAKWRAKIENCPLILGSATPSLETWLESKEKSYLPSPLFNNEGEQDKHYLNLPERIGRSKLPTIEIVDLRTELQQGNRSILSRKLQKALTNMHSKGEQGILFVPRRGHSTFVSCRSCGYVLECPHCDVSLSYHYASEGATELLRCHYCNYSTLQPKHCPECNSPYLKFFGSGTQKVVLELNKMFPQIRCLRFDSDTTKTKGAHRRLLDQFRAKDADLLIGTQMLTKGIDIPGVTLVGVVAADGLLNLSDYRASERAFQTLTQVAGRAGRGENPGKVIIQTYNTENPVIEAVLKHNYESFVERELEQRKELNYPPYGRLIVIKLSGLEELKVQETAILIADKLTDFNLKCEILGPAPANIMRIAQRYRWQILLKFPFPDDFTENLFNIKELRSYCPASISLTIDVDPLQLD
jgi:primosomal protein N' (replication factor Y)